MDAIKAIFAPRRKVNEEEYEPLTETDESATLQGSVLDEAVEDEIPFSWVEYTVFALLGVAMLWAWNMFLAAAPYFQHRFSSSPSILANFQSAIISVSTSTNLGAMLILTNIQSGASYPFRINIGLMLSCAVFGLLTISTSHFLWISEGTYLTFLLCMVALSAWATGMIQNGAFAFAASFGRPEYMQAIMAGQGVAGILPPLVQLLSFLAVPPKPKIPEEGGEEEAGTAAFIYFLTAVGVSAGALVAFVPLAKRHQRIVQNRAMERSTTSIDSARRRYVSMPTLLRKLHWLAAAVFMCFCVTMFFPVLTSKILSVNKGGRLFEPGAFIPLGFLFWNLGDLLGRMSTMFPALSLRHRPAALFAISLGRILWLPLYMLCNITGRDPVIRSDLFYLLVVQLIFGLSNGWLGSSAMMAAGEWVDEDEREAAGSFMGLCLTAGLTVGSFLSFTASGV